MFQEKELDELTKRFHFKNFLDQVGDSSMPDWKRQLLARQMAEKAKKEYEEKKKVSASTSWCFHHLQFSSVSSTKISLVFFA